MLRKKNKEKNNITISNDPVTIDVDVITHLTETISLNEYLSKHSRRRNLDRTIIAYCHKRQYYFKTKIEWDNIIIEFFK